MIQCTDVTTRIPEAGDDEGMISWRGLVCLGWGSDTAIGKQRDGISACWKNIWDLAIGVLESIADDETCHVVGRP